MNENILYVAFGIWLLPLNIIFSRFIHVVHVVLPSDQVRSALECTVLAVPLSKGQDIQENVPTISLPPLFVEQASALKPWNFPA